MLVVANHAAAYYSPSTGRWLSRDPVGEPGFELLRTTCFVPKAGQVFGSASLPPSRLLVRDEIREPNTYVFVANNPITAFDLFGLKTLDVGNCQIVIFYGHGVSNDPYTFNFAGPCSAAAFFGCWDADSDKNIPSNNQIPGIPTTDKEMDASDLDTYVTQAWADAKAKAANMCKLCNCVCPTITITAVQVKTGDPLLDIWVPGEHHYHPDETIQCAKPKSK